MKKIVTAITLALGLSACATDDIYINAQKDILIAQAQVTKAKAEAETARYAAISTLAAGAGETARVVGVMALAMGNNPSQVAQQMQQSIQRPVSTGDKALAWAGLLVPSVIQAYGIASNTRMSITQSNNARDVALSTNDTFAAMSGQIQGNSSVDSHNVSTDSHSVDSHNVDDHTNNPYTQIPPGKICVPNVDGIVVCM